VGNRCDFIPRKKGGKQRKGKNKGEVEEHRVNSMEILVYHVRDSRKKRGKQRKGKKKGDVEEHRVNSKEILVYHVRDSHQKK